jgi:short-subunit dehydrogenase
MKIDFRGQTVLITGATRGMGKQFADDFASLGANLILTGTDKRQIQALNRIQIKKRDQENITRSILPTKRVTRLLLTS